MVLLTTFLKSACYGVEIRLFSGILADKIALPMIDTSSLKKVA